MNFGAIKVRVWNYTQDLSSRSSLSPSRSHLIQWSNGWPWVKCGWEDEDAFMVLFSGKFVSAGGHCLGVVVLNIFMIILPQIPEIHSFLCLSLFLPSAWWGARAQIGMMGMTMMMRWWWRWALAVNHHHPDGDLEKRLLILFYCSRLSK